MKHEPAPDSAWSLTQGAPCSWPLTSGTPKATLHHHGGAASAGGQWGPRWSNPTSRNPIRSTPGIPVQAALWLERLFWGPAGLSQGLTSCYFEALLTVLRDVLAHVPQHAAGKFCSPTLASVLLLLLWLFLPSFLCSFLFFHPLPKASRSPGPMADLGSFCSLLLYSSRSGGEPIGAPCPSQPSPPGFRRYTQPPRGPGCFLGA